MSPDRTRRGGVDREPRSDRGRVVVFDLATMRSLASIDQAGTARRWTAGFWHGNAVWLDDRRLVAGSPSGRIFVWEPDTGRVVQRINDPPTGHRRHRRRCASPPTGRTLVAAGIDIHVMMGLRPAHRETVVAPRRKTVNGNIFVDDTAKVVWARRRASGRAACSPYDLATGERIASELNGQHGTVCDVRREPGRQHGRARELQRGDDRVVGARRPHRDRRAACGPRGGRRPRTCGVPTAATSRCSATRCRRRSKSSTCVPAHGSRHRASRAGTTATRSSAAMASCKASTARSVTSSSSTPTAARHATPASCCPARARSRPRPRSRRGTSPRTASSTGTSSCVDTARGKIVRTIATGIGPIYGVGWNVDGAPRVRGRPVRARRGVSTSPPGRRSRRCRVAGSNLVVSPDRTLMAVNAFNGTITFYDTRTLQHAGDPLTGGTAFTPRCGSRGTAAPS